MLFCHAENGEKEGFDDFYGSCCVFSLVVPRRSAMTVTIGWVGSAVE